jgi:hypothetical protein
MDSTRKTARILIEISAKTFYDHGKARGYSSNGGGSWPDLNNMVGFSS